EAAIQLGELAAERLEVLLVRVPAAVGECDAADARLDESARRQKLLDAAVAVARTGVLAAQVEGPANAAGGDHVEGTRGERGHAAHRAAGVHFAAGAVELGQEAATVVGALARDAAGEGEVVETRAIGRKGAVGDAEIARLAAERLPTQADERRNVGSPVA